MILGVLVWFILGMLIGIVIVLGLRLRQLTETLDHVRFGTYELTTGLRDDVHDLQESLWAANIHLSRKHASERNRRKSMSLDDQLADAQAAWDAAVAEHEKQQGQKEWDG